MRENTLFKFGVTSLIGVFAFTGSVVAQVDEIIVSAQKRDQALVDTPVSVAVITSKDLEMTEANDISELQFSVPSVKFQQNQNALNKPFISGVLVMVTTTLVLNHLSVLL